MIFCNHLPSMTPTGTAGKSKTEIVIVAGVIKPSSRKNGTFAVLIAKKYHAIVATKTSRATRKGNMKICTAIPPVKDTKLVKPDRLHHRTARFNK